MENIMKVTWLTQAGLLFENDRIKVLVDPYLSSANIDGQRRIPVDESFFEIEPNMILITHSHPYHLDKETLDKFLARDGNPITVLAGGAAYTKLRSFGYEHNIVLLTPHTVWSEGGVTFYSVKAEHSERDAVGFILDDGDKTYYVSGDTLYNFDVIDDCLDLVEDGVDYAFLPINGRGNNMNAKDAADFAYEIGAKCAIPIHYGLFDNVDPEDFDFDDKLVLTPYETTEL